MSQGQCLRAGVLTMLNALQTASSQLLSRGETMQEVISCAAKLGLSGLQLAPLANDADDDGAEGRNGASAGAEADTDIMAAQLREQLASRLRASPQQGPPEAWACLEVSMLHSKGRRYLRIIWSNGLCIENAHVKPSRFL